VRCVVGVCVVCAWFECVLMQLPFISLMKK
jgi:hypothetical protein